MIDGGTELDDAVAVARLVAATGQVDYINTAIGVATASLHTIEASMATPRGYANYIPAAIRAAVDVPVIGVGRFGDPEQAERALGDGVCDLVGVVRGQIAEPEFAALARAGTRAGAYLPGVQSGLHRAGRTQPRARLRGECPGRVPSRCRRRPRGRVGGSW